MPKFSIVLLCAASLATLSAPLFCKKASVFSFSTSIAVEAFVSILVVSVLSVESIAALSEVRPPTSAVIGAPAVTALTEVPSDSIAAA